VVAVVVEDITPQLLEVVLVVAVEIKADQAD
jgi:hypothetical protein